VKFNGKGNGKVSKSLTITANTEKGTETVKIGAFVEKDPNAPAPAAAVNKASTTVNPLATNNGAVKKSSTQPGHEGHNHD
jgi:hypothetical protein